jgi:hypothetical protein
VLGSRLLLLLRIDSLSGLKIVSMSTWMCSFSANLRKKLNIMNSLTMSVT